MTRDATIAQEKRAWVKTITRFAEAARLAGYIVMSLDDGAWRLEKDGKTILLFSDVELYLYLVDQKVVRVNRLYPRPGVGQ